MASHEICSDDRRRQQIREKNLNGVDYVEVAGDQSRLPYFS